MKLKLTLPSVLTTVLGVIAGVLSGVLASQLFDLFGLHLDLEVSIGLAAIGTVAGPLTGSAFRSAIHFPAKWLPAVTTVMTALGVIAAAVSNLRLQGVLEGIDTLISWVLFGPGVAAVAAAVKRRYQMGRLPAQRPVGLKDFAEYLATALPAPPATFAVPATTYPMDGNDRYGDCTFAGVDHLIRAFNKLYGAGGKKLATLKQIVTAYFKQTGGQDTGCVEADVLKTWHTVGLLGHTIAGYAPVPPKSIEQIKQAVAFYGGCYLGIDCPQSAQEQFQEQEQTGKQVPWTYDPSSPIEGGHCIVALGYTADGLLCATWGGIALVTWGFIDHLLEEAWVILSDELVKAKKDTLEIAVAVLQADLSRV